MKEKTAAPAPALLAQPEGKTKPDIAPPREIGGSKGLEPTRYGDWEVNGRCTDF